MQRRLFTFSILLSVLSLCLYQLAYSTAVFSTSTKETLSPCSKPLKHYLIQLAKSSQNEYSQINEQEYGYHTVSWLELIDILNQSNCQFSEENVIKMTSVQLKNLSIWQSNYPEHPALYFFPSLFAHLLPDENSLNYSLQKVNGNNKIEASRSIQLAILIPLAERFQPFSDNLLKSIYQSSKRLDINLNLYDTSSSSLAEILNQIRNNGDTCILGPLQKEKLQEIAQFAINIPVLGLNMLPPKTPSHNYLFEMSFSDESQADFLSQKLEKNRLTNGVLFFSKNNKRDQKLAEKIANNHLSAFGQWRNITPINTKKTDFGLDIKKSLLLDQSFRRHKRLESLLETELEFIPRRRQDIDFISLVIPKRNLLTLYPQLRYWFIDKLPIYSVLNEKELIRASKSQQQKEGFEADIDLPNLNLILPSWFKQQLTQHENIENFQTTKTKNYSDFLSNKLSFLGKNAIELISKTQCLRLEQLIHPKKETIKTPWKLDIKSKTFILSK